MEISPETIVFHPPFEEVSSSYITLKNTTDSTLIYKIKTTAPHLYCVKPNAASIRAGDELKVTITRQGQAVDTSKHCKDKFLVLSAPIEDSVLSHTEKISDLWPDIESQSKDGKKTFDAQKLKVQYENQAHSRENSEAPETSVYHPAPTSSSANSHSEKSEPAKIPDDSTTTDHTPEAVTADGFKIPHKSREIDMGDAKTGPHLDNSYLPSGPKPERAEDLEAKLEKEQKKKVEEEEPGAQEISQEYAEAAAAGAAAGVAAVSKSLDARGVHHKPDSYYAGEINYPASAGHKEEHHSTPSTNEEEVDKGKMTFKTVEKPAEQELKSGDKGKLVVNDIESKTKPSSGDKGKLTVNDAEPKSTSAGDKGKLTVNEAEKPTPSEKTAESSSPSVTTKTPTTTTTTNLPRPSVEVQEDEPAQEVPLNVAVILVFIAFFIGWKFF